MNHPNAALTMAPAEVLVLPKDVSKTASALVEIVCPICLLNFQTNEQMYQTHLLEEHTRAQGFNFGIQHGLQQADFHNMKKASDLLTEREASFCKANDELCTHFKSVLKFYYPETDS